jgi:hypothetical protein
MQNQVLNCTVKTTRLCRDDGQDRRVCGRQVSSNDHPSNCVQNRDQMMVVLMTIAYIEWHPALHEKLRKTVSFHHLTSFIGQLIQL